jgi:hypothetical protein
MEVSSKVSAETSRVESRPGVRADRAAVLEAAFAKIFADRNFQDEAEKVEISPHSVSRSGKSSTSF